MFANTITLTIDAVDKVLNRVNQDQYGSEYQMFSDTESIVMKIRHSSDKKDSDSIIMKRHNVLVEHTVYPTPTTAIEKYTYTWTVRHGSFNSPNKAKNLAIGAGSWTSSVTADLTAGVN